VCVRVRASFVRYIFQYSGENVNIATGVRFGRGSKISIGNRSGLGEGCYLVAMDKITIGNDVMIGPEVMMLTGGHDFKDKNKTLIKQEVIVQPIKIGNDCWIGARVIILPGVEIGDRVIVGAGSVVTKSLAKNGVYAGNPAKKIKELE